MIFILTYSPMLRRREEVKKTLVLDEIEQISNLNSDNIIVKNLMTEKPKEKYRRHNKILLQNVNEAKHQNTEVLDDFKNHLEIVNMKN